MCVVRQLRQSEIRQLGVTVPGHQDVGRLDITMQIGVGESVLLPLPPNRTGGSPAYGSPVGGVTWLRIDRPQHGHAEEKTNPAEQRKHWASVDGPSLARGLARRCVC